MKRKDQLPLKSFLVICGMGIIFMSSLNGCKKNEQKPATKHATYDVTSSLTGKQAGVDTAKATAEFRGSYTTQNRKLSYTITYSRIDPAAINVHQGTATAIGNILVGIGKNSGNVYKTPVSGEMTLTQQQEAAFLKIVYLNFTTSKNPNGEIRGQLRLTKRK